MEPNDPDPDGLIHQMRKLSCSTTNTTSSSAESQSSYTSPPSPRALRRPQRSRAIPSSPRPKSMISMTPYSRSSRGQSVNKDDMDMEMTSPTAKNFIDSLIQEINGTPIPPSPSTFDFSATDLSRQRQSSISDPSRIWSGPSTSPLEFPVHDEKSVTPEQERAAIARYRRERFPLPEHEWWKLESKHRVALAALRRMEEDQSRESSQDESHGQGHREPSYFRRNGDEGVVSGLKPEVLEALAFSHSPNPETVKPVGENGLDIKNPAQFSHALIRPPDCNPEAWEHWQHLKDVTDLQRHAWFGARLSAYSFEKGDIFDLRQTRVQQRLRRTEECWQHGRAAMNIETQFWNAVYERENQRDAFAQRDTYLLQANAVEFAAKIFVYNRSEREIHEQIFHRYLLTAFNCPEEDQGDPNVDIRDLAIALLNLGSISRDGQVPIAQDQDSLQEATKRLDQLRFN